jgi:hypothetical protein
MHSLLAPCPATVNDDLKSGLDEVGPGPDSEQGLDAFFKLTLPPWLRVTANVRWIDPATPIAEDAITAARRTRTSPDT